MELAHVDPERSAGSDAGQPLLNCVIDIIGMKNLRESVTTHDLFGVEASEASATSLVRSATSLSNSLAIRFCSLMDSSMRLVGNQRS